jgi:TetR/AcrR family transcriptional regulator, cholesterol catabolism regulator
MPRVIKHPDIRRAELLDRAFASFVERGYDNVSLNHLISDAGVSKGAFYHWFPSKDALITALADRSAREHCQPSKVLSPTAAEMRLTA